MLAVILFIFGLIFGSFVNALVWRIKNNKDWVRARSICPKCKHTLAAKDLIPLVSWHILKGKCRYCKKAISVQYPLVELLVGVLFAMSYTFWVLPFDVLGTVSFLFWLSSIVILVALFVYDLKWQILPNQLVLAVSATSVLVLLFNALQKDNPGLVVGGLVSGMLIFGLFYILFRVSNGAWIGGGDVKLGFALGILAMTPAKALLLIFIASLLGTIVSLPLLANKRLKMKAKIAFGPFLITAAVIVLLFGEQIIAWYVDTILYL
jgi:prepilin signal peptidase PulO-like enzyme (type II secretory pathway)